MTGAAIDTALLALPGAVTDRSGSVFYTAPSAFAGPHPLYILGLNPGGDPAAQRGNSVARAIEEWRGWPERRSAYLDERWEGAAPGSWGMQPRMHHLFDRIGRDLRDTPAANVVFVRSRDEAALAAEMPALLDACWPVHQAVIDGLSVSTVLALGSTAGRWVRRMIGAGREVDRFVEANDRRWPSTAHAAPDGRVVVTLTHPGRVDWRNPAADPSPLVARILARG